MRWWSLLPFLLPLGCDGLRSAAEGVASGATAAPPVSSAHAAPAAGVASRAAEKAPGAGQDEQDKAERGRRYGVPFAWEVPKDEPLAKTRLFLSQALDDNDLNMARGKQHFATLAGEQHPRATVVTCADARVQSDAWDATSEGDDFTVRNLGNAIGNAAGSVAYGVEQLHTPLLLILGHTGCEAVKAVLDHTPNLAEPIAKELSNVKVSSLSADGKGRDAWTQAVVSNVNAQVDVALERFGTLVGRGELTIVGAVYDLRNDMGAGAGRLNVVNVNANTDPKRLQAFVRAIRDTATPLPERALAVMNGLDRVGPKANGDPASSAVDAPHADAPHADTPNPDTPR